MFNKLKIMLNLLKRLSSLPQDESVAKSSDIQKIVDFINFRFQENKDLALIRSTSHQQGKFIRRVLGYETLGITLETDKSVALDSLDHIHPWGTKQDNSINIEFNNILYALIPFEKLKVLDIGCSGGGFVRSMHDAGILAVGIEGSDYSKIRGRAEWGVIPHRLFTADATTPFKILANKKPLKFTVITAWEFIEHIETSQLNQVFENIDKHLDEHGVVIMSVSPIDDWVDGVNLHRTVQDAAWWYSKIEEFGFINHSELISIFAPNKWIRSEENASGSFHLVMTRKNESISKLNTAP